jgi:hypothetical protein
VTTANRDRPRPSNFADRTEPSGQRCTTSPFIGAGIRGAMGRAVTLTDQPSPFADIDRKEGEPSNDASTFGSDQFCRPPTTLSRESTDMNGIDTAIPRPRRSPTPPNTSWYGPTGVESYAIIPPITTTGRPKSGSTEDTEDEATPDARPHHTMPVQVTSHGASGADGGSEATSSNVDSATPGTASSSAGFTTPPCPS